MVASPSLLPPPLLPLRPMHWEDVLVSYLLLDAVAEPQDHPGFRAAWRACPSTTVLKHLDVDAPRLLRGLHEQERSGAARGAGQPCMARFGPCLPAAGACTGGKPRVPHALTQACGAPSPCSAPRETSCRAITPRGAGGATACHPWPTYDRHMASGSVNT